MLLARSRPTNRTATLWSPRGASARLDTRRRRPASHQAPIPRTASSDARHTASAAASPARREESRHRARASRRTRRSCRSGRARRLGLEHEHVEVRLQLEQLPGRPEPEIPTADDDHVCARVPLERPSRHDLAGLLEPPAVAGVAHVYAGGAGRLASAKPIAITTAAASGTTIVQNSGSPPAAAPIETAAAET